MDIPDHFLSARNPEYRFILPPVLIPKTSSSFLAFSLATMLNLPSISLYFPSSRVYRSTSRVRSSLSYLLASMSFLMVLSLSSRFTSFISWLCTSCSRLLIFYLRAFSEATLSFWPAPLELSLRRASHSIFCFSMTLLSDSTSISSSATLLPP